MLRRLIEAGVKSVTSASIETTNVDHGLQKLDADAALVSPYRTVVHDDRCWLQTSIY